MAKNKAQPSFDVVIPTYSGEEYLPLCFDSILNQRPKLKFGVVVVIDGPNDTIKGITRVYAKKFKLAAITFVVHQLPTNQGRFRARLKGAELASADQLLFIDDRVTFSSDYFSDVLAEKKKILIPNVQEATAKNSVNRSLFLLRRRIYGKDKFGTSFKPFYINKENFEKSPKGTTSLWVGKKAFIDACSSLGNGSDTNRYTNDDTKIFRYLIDHQRNIFKSSKARIYYNPRSSTWQEIVHIYERGPRFIDYYIKPGTRFFLPLIAMSIIIAAAIIACILYPGLILWIAVLLILVDAALALILYEYPKDLVLLFTYPLIFIAFASGVTVGAFKKLTIN